MTFEQAKKVIIDSLKDDGWIVKDGIKVPHASKGGVKVWLKPQSLHGSRDSQLSSDARSLFTCPKKLAKYSKKTISDYLTAVTRELVDFHEERNV